MPRRRWTVEDLRREARDLARQLKRRPSSNEFARHTGVSSSTISRHGGWDAIAGPADPREKLRDGRQVMHDFDRPSQELERIARGNRYLVTCAVSDSPAHAGFLAAARQWEQWTGGRLVVLPILYKNPTRRDEPRETEWDSALHPFMVSQEIRPHPQLAIVPTKIQATTNNPLPPRMLAMTRHRSAVFGHPQVALRCVPTRPQKRPKILYTSGAITETEYSDTVTGDVGRFHHSLAATIVEVDGDSFWLRDAHWNGVGFVDIDLEFGVDGVYEAPPAAAIVMGDVHVGLHDDAVIDATLHAPDSLLAVTRAEAVYLHDLYDGRAPNPHNLGRAITLAEIAARGADDVRRELDAVAEWLQELPPGPEYRVVGSNHDDFLTRWLERGRPEPRDAELFHWLSWRILRESLRSGQRPLALQAAIEAKCERGDISWLTENDSSVVHGFECALHGHRGPNGARGTPAGLARVGTKVASAHTHSPMIFQGNRTAGMSAIWDHGYNKGLSGWDQAHVLIDGRGYSQMVFFRGGRFRA